jgi:kynurenine formamidase
MAQFVSGAFCLIASLTIHGQSLRVDFKQGICVGIPLDFAGVQPCHFGAEPASTVPMNSGGFIGDTRRGGPCNVPVITMNPHCNGTHTESVGHIVNEPVSVHEVLSGGMILACLVSVFPVTAQLTDEHYLPNFEQNDKVISRNELERVLLKVPDERLHALLIRTLPNNPNKKSARYGENVIPPYMTIEAIEYLNQRGVRHLLVDIPSVDRMHDDGMLTVHHRFWNIVEHTHSLQPESKVDRTITEMIFVPDVVSDGYYLLNLQIPAFSIDVAPSRPWLFPVEFL